MNQHIMEAAVPVIAEHRKVLNFVCNQGNTIKTTMTCARRVQRSLTVASVGDGATRLHRLVAELIRTTTL